MILPNTSVTATTIGSMAMTALRRMMGPWRVIASFPRAVYAQSGDEVIVLTSRDVPPGPIHVTTTADQLQAEPGSEMPVTGDRIKLDGRRVDLAGGASWVGRLPHPARVAAASPILTTALAPHAQASALMAPPYSARLSRLSRAADPLDLDARGSLLGFGPGLTPAGDDVIAGFLVASVALGRLAPGSWEIGREAQHLTSTISLAYLRGAAVGQAIAPVHEIFTAAIAGDAGECEAACQRLAAAGATSGADIALGLYGGIAGAYPSEQVTARNTARSS